MGQIDLFKKYSIGLCVKNPYQKMQIWTYNERYSLISWHEKSLDKLTTIKINDSIKQTKKTVWKC